MKVVDLKTPVPAGHIRKTYKFFDLNTFADMQDTRDIAFTPAKDLAEAQQRIGGDEATMLKAFNAFLRAETLAAVEREVTAQGGRRTTVLAVVKPFRSLPPFNSVFKLDSDGKPIIENGEKVIDRQKQTRKILEMIKASPEMVQAIKDGSANADDSDDNETENDD